MNPQEMDTETNALVRKQGVRELAINLWKKCKVALAKAWSTIFAITIPWLRNRIYAAQVIPTIVCAAYPYILVSNVPQNMAGDQAL